MVKELRGGSHTGKEEMITTHRSICELYSFNKGRRCCYDAAQTTDAVKTMCFYSKDCPYSYSIHH
jgi:hypothetical protein